MSGIIRGEQKNIRVKVLLTIDTNTLALHSETPLVIRSYIIPHSYGLSLRVSCVSESKGDTLCLPHSYPNLNMCCNRAVPHPHLVFCLLSHQPLCKTFLVEIGGSDVATRISCPRMSFVSYCSPKVAARKRYHQQGVQHQ